MTACNLRSLLIAVIFLSNCITWTASRHHFTHNVHGHRSRHRRQGAGLYLSASYVIPGGEGEGWGEWGNTSPCSRTCGGGVAHQKRICLAIGPDGQPQCRGGDTKYFSCETQDCPPDAKDFRAEQCADFNDKDFRGAKYSWVPYTKAVNPCELNCMPHGERFYYRHKPKVIDGTRCSQDSYDVCVDGVCQMVGCDMMLGSNAREDKCRECRGNGSNCITTAGLLDTQDLIKGYNDILLIPAGSTTIVIEEIAPSNNYLALRNKNGTYYLNGHYHIDFPKSTIIAGALWTYERSQSSYPAPDKLRCMGPTTEPLYLSLLLQDVNVGIEYEYSLPKDMAPYTDKQYHWVHEEFSPCNASCGGGSQSRNVTCRSREILDIVDDGLCDEGLKPVINQTCNTDPCPAEWVEGPWSECSKHCGKDGVRKRTVTCEKIIANGIASLVAERECFDLHGPKPELYQECNRDAKCPTWFVGHWKACDKLCDEGKQTRQVVCHLKQNGRIKIFEDSECESEKPETEKPCMLSLCDGVDWITTEWNGCDTCLSKARTRLALCATKDYKVYNDSFCDYHHRPITEEPCDDVPPCEYQWYASQWSKCSVECGEGVRTRKVFCGLYINNEVQEVEDLKCSDQPKYNDTKPCLVPDEKCPSQWYAGPWTECTEKCGGGDQFRRVMCMRGNEHAMNCKPLTVPSATQACNTHACNADDLMPVDPLSPPIVDEYCTEEDYAEVGLDEIKLSTMLGDDPSTADSESEFVTTDESSTFEDSTTPIIDYDYTDTSFATDTSDLGSGETPESTTDEPTASSNSESTNTDNTNATTVSELITKGSTSSLESSISDKTDITSSGYSSASSDGSSTPTEESTFASESTDEEFISSSDSTVTDNTDSSTTLKPEVSTIDDSSDATGSTDATDGDTKSTEIKTTDSSVSSSDDTSGSDDATEPTSESSVTSSDASSTRTSTDGEITTAASEGLSPISTESSDSTLVTESEFSSSSKSESTSPESSVSGSELTSPESSTMEAETTSPATSISGSESASPESSTSSSPESSSLRSESISSESRISESESTSPVSSTSESEFSESDSTSSGSSTSISESISTETSISDSTLSESSTSETESTSPESSISVSESTSPETSTSESESTSSETSTSELESTSPEISTSVSESTSPESSSMRSESTSSEFTTSILESSPTVSSTSPESSTSESKSTSPESSTSESVSTSPKSSTFESSSVGSSSLRSESTSSESSTSGIESSPASSTTESEVTSTGSSSLGSELTSLVSSTTESGSTTSKLESSPTVSSSTSSESSSPESSTPGLESMPPESSTSESTPASSSSSRSESISPESSTSGFKSSSPESSTASFESSSPESSTSGFESSSTVSSILRSESTSPEYKSSESETTSPALGTLSTESGTSESISTIPDFTTTSSVSSTLGLESSTLESKPTLPESTLSGSSTEAELTSISSGISEPATTEGPTTDVEASASTTELSTTGTGGLSTEVTTHESTEHTSSTPWTLTTVVTDRPICKPRKTLNCNKTKFGCCPDRKTAAAGPFDDGCPKPRTCKESLFGCCPDGVSPAQGENEEGCPVIPCEETLFGCCTSDNKTAALGNDDDGCPAPCTVSEFGCCADEETEATGENGEGCPEYQSPTDETTTESITISESSTSESSTSESSSSEGSTSEGSTSNESTSEGISSSTESSTTPGGCTVSEFGCCYDNETEASGPEMQGCPCTATEFGCCPDGVSPAQGEDDKGCPGACRNSKYGCCSDGERPAHGPDFEGCCLLTAFGCCPDNRKAAEGPHLEGCGCQHAQFGCCPDKVTVAQGPNNEGCGCQYTEFGCCPDRHTTASGPNFEGCSCRTYQFGCCPDGVTIATSPDQQSCSCKASTYGCCSDEKTPAAGPNGAGCDCSTSKYGCCPDGETEATGTQFLGCANVPENKQAVCSLSSDAGPCSNYTVVYFYDRIYGGCSRFWYGGCDGNGNKFTTKEDCEDVCVRPAPKDACKLPDVKGPCDAEHVRWYYNSTREQCLPFRYGGCLGNANNFDSRELCQTKCEPDKTTDTCNLPIEQGPCAGNFSRWGYNSESRSCEQFIWGGCAGNSNQFKTEAACQIRCDTHSAVCSKQQEAGDCDGKEALWSFSQTENRCVPFYYTGCGGNDNRFESRESCEQSCPSVYVPDKCTLPAEVGDCSDYRVKWFYDTRIKRCRQFYYGGCGGNMNKFDTESECFNECTEPVTTTTTTTTMRPTQTQPAPQPEPQPEPQPQPEPEPDREAFCFLKINAGGLCSVSPVATRYAYNSTLGKCVTFQYNGCGGNQNNFPNEEFCTYYCHPVQDICQLPMMTGTCNDSIMSWFYNPVDDSCSQFTYSGCDGNGNRFESREACESRCRTGPEVEPKPATPATAVTAAVDIREEISAECRASLFLEECRSAGEVWYYNPRHHDCVSHVNRESGRTCRHTATFHSQEACERKCGAFQGIDVCKQRLDAGPCQEFVTKVYFDSNSNTCKEFAYSGCLGGANRFSSIEECTDLCGAKATMPDVCSLIPDQGNCGSYVEQWYYDASHGDCSQFVYTGCGGNNNRFDTREDCEHRCKPVVTTTTAVTPIVHTEVQYECKTPSSLAPCGYNLTVFYYDSNTKSCLPSEFGACRHPNSYRSEEECERQCGAFRGEVDICKAELDPGLCRDTVIKYYFDFVKGRCESFNYGGCGGGPNRFSTLNECEEFCGDSGPGTNEVDCESYKRECAKLTCDSIVRSSAPGGCESCACADTTPPCQQFVEECERISCPYGVRKVQDNDCERCICDEDPCLRNTCTEYQRCVAISVADPVTRQPTYSFRCEEEEAPPVPLPLPEPEVTAIEGRDVTLRCLFHSNPPPKVTWKKGEISIDGNVGRYLVTSDGALRIVSLHNNDTGVYICIADNGLGIATQQITLIVARDETNEVTPDCSRYEAECSRLNCATGVEHLRTADGCSRCRCTAPRVDCEPYREACSRLNCYYGLEKSVGHDGCERCACVDPCAPGLVTCGEGERCVVVSYRDPLSEGLKYSSECRAVTKPGLCPADDVFSNDILCEDECSDDAECRGNGKCCVRGCRRSCVEPAASTRAPLFTTTTHIPDLPAPPRPLQLQEPDVSYSEGDKATLRCLFHSNPPPKIAWRRGEITINGNVGRYRLTSDGALEIVSLYRNDTGVYICVADNGLGTAKQEINLIVTDPKDTPVGIAGDENAVITGELDKPLVVRCLAYGYPVPDVFWTRDNFMVPFNDAVYEIRGNSLLIRSLSIETLGQYTCQAYNGIGKAASWVVLVRAYRPEGYFSEHEYLVIRNGIATTRRFPMTTTLETTTSTTTTTTTERPVFFTVPVNVHVSTTYSTLNIGTELRLACEVDGFPEPIVYWSKDGQRLEPDDRTSITGNTISRLAISRVTVSDSGLYGCHADNGYSSHSDNAQINVQQLTVPAKCTDNPFFANCDLIVRSKFCNHKYYSKFCCKSCVEAGQLDPQLAEAQADQPYRRK